MKRITFLIIVCLITAFAHAQNSNEHLKFMGIELDGTISDFQTKLLAKGLKVSPLSKQQPNGMRSYEGTFSGEDAQIIVWYNPRSKEVYRAKAIITRYGEDMIKQLMSSMERKLDLKYGTEDKWSESVKDDYLHEFDQYSYLTEYGSIDLFVVSTGFSSQNTFYLHIDYRDLINYRKNTQDEMEDL